VPRRPASSPAPIRQIPASSDNFLVSDPNLKQVVARTYEAGLRGRLRTLGDAGRLTWTLGLYRTDSQDDILNVPSAITGLGFFENAGNTRRQGLDAGITYKSDRWSLYGDYGLVDATFQSAIILRSPANPSADANGLIAVRPGDHLPSIPQHRLKLGADYSLTENWKIGGDLIIASDQYLRGDEANQNPKIPGYFVVNLRTSYEIGERFEVFGLVQNLFEPELRDVRRLLRSDEGSLARPRQLALAQPSSAARRLRRRPPQLLRDR